MSDNIVWLIRIVENCYRYFLRLWRPDNAMPGFCQICWDHWDIHLSFGGKRLHISVWFISVRYWHVGHIGWKVNCFSSFNCYKMIATDLLFRHSKRLRYFAWWLMAIRNLWALSGLTFDVSNSACFTYTYLCLLQSNPTWAKLLDVIFIHHLFFNITRLVFF